MTESGKGGSVSIMDRTRPISLEYQITLCLLMLMLGGPLLGAIVTAQTFENADAGLSLRAAILYNV